MTKKIIIPVAAIVITAGTLFAASDTFAQTPAPGKENGFSGLAEFISQKFGLDKTQVQNAVKEYHEKQVTSREQSRLDALVKEGKITADQEKAILEKLNSVRSQFDPESLKDLTPEERRSKMQEMHNGLKSWAESQNINPDYVLPKFGKRMNGRGMHWEGKPGTPSAEVTPTQ